MMRLGRRAFLRGAAGLGAIALGLPLSACGSASGPISSVPADTLRVAYSDLEPVLDPHRWTSPRGPRTFAPMFDALTFIQNDGQLRPALAVAWSQPSATTWQFRLRASDAKFQNGEVFGPDSVQLTFERLMAGNLPLSGLVSNVDGVDILDPATVRVTLKEPDADFARRASALYMLPPRYFGQVGEGGFASQPIGTGFWMVNDVEAGQRLSLGLFRDTWRGARGADPPPIDKLIIDVLPDASRRAESLRALELDVATELSSEGAPALKTAGFLVETTDLAKASARDAAWAPAPRSPDVLGAAANVQGLTPLPNGSWWFDRVTKTAMQRVAVAGGA
jgi:peptide/nickel transport system substrate-binding protein